MEAYSGWGGAQKAFSEKAEGEWGEIRDRLKELLSDDEFASQRHTVLTAFYTPAPVIGAIYDALREAGIGQGDTPAAILEPGCGSGNFMRLAPADLALDFHGRGAHHRRRPRGVPGLPRVLRRRHRQRALQRRYQD